jgi:hypothetical protein
VLLLGEICGLSKHLFCGDRVWVGEFQHEAEKDEALIGIDGDGGIDRDNDGVVDNPFFPTGYEPFYLMKYELSQEQWRDFFNLLDQDEQDNRLQSKT